MKLFGLQITRQKAAPPNASAVTAGSGGWVGLIRESFPGAWQRNIEIRTDTVLSSSAVFRCISLISSDIAKMRIRLVEQDANGIWLETKNSAHSPVLRKPNRFQNRIQFFQTWMESKLVHGNTYILKERDDRNVVIRLYPLNPNLVTVLVAPDGEVYYELHADDLSGIRQRLVLPASEIIHDRMNTLHHPLVGLSPIHACGLAAIQGLRIQENSTLLFANGTNPGGVLSAPGHIDAETAARVKAEFEKKFTGKNVGKLAVLGDGLKYESMTITATDAQLIEQLKLTSEIIASVFGVPAYKIGAIEAPTTTTNIEALDSQYYSQCLQIHIESIELALDIGLELKGNLGTEFDLDDLLRMDTATMVQAASEGVKAGIMAPNEARLKFSLPPVKGGDSPYLQIQNYSLEALDKRDQQSVPVTPGLDNPPEETEDDGNGDGDTAEPEDNADSEERQRNVIDFIGAKIERFARDHERRHSA